MIKYSITIKDEDTKIVKDDFENEELLLSKNSAALTDRVAQCFERFKQEAEADGKDLGTPDIIIKAKLIWQTG